MDTIFHIPIISGTILLAGLAVFATAWGRCLLRVFHITISETAERGLIATGLGLGSLQVIPFILFSLGVGSPSVFRIVIALVGLLLLPDAIAVLRIGLRSLGVFANREWWEYFLLSFFLLLLGSIYLRAVCPVTDIDALLYHLTIAQRFLTEGRFVHLITITPSNWPLCLESLFSILLAINSEAPIAIVQFLFGVLIIVTVYIYANRTCGRICAAVAVFVLLFQWMFWWEMATGYIDLGLTAFATLMLFSLEKGNLASNQSSWTLLAAIFAGIAATAKLQGGWIIIVFAALLLIDNIENPRHRSMKNSLALIGIAVCIVLPWYIRTWIITGNPVYPMLYGIFGGKEWTSEGWTRYVESYLITDAISTGLPLTKKVVWTAYALRIATGLTLAAIIIRLTRDHRHNLSVRFAILFAACIFIGSAANMRFLLPAFPAFAVWISVSLQRWKHYLPRIICVAAPCAIIWIALFKVQPKIGIATRGAFGLITPDQYMENDTTIIDYQVAKYVNKYLPPSARVLLCLQREHTALYSCQSYWANCRLQDTFHYNSIDRLMSDLRRIGVTHIVLGPGFSEWYGTHPVWKERKEIELPALTALVKEAGTKIFESQGVTLFELHLPPSGI